ncbi:MAG: LPS assembly protein LptD [Akkermansiaceae bacterium]
MKRLLVPSLLFSAAMFTQMAWAQDNDPAGGLLGANIGGIPEMPKSIRVQHDGEMELDTDKGTFLFLGKVNVSADNGLTLKASRVLVNAKTETAHLSGHVAVRQKATKAADGTIIPGIQLFANRVLLDGKKKIITLDGDVSIYQGASVHRGKHAVYHYADKKLEIKKLASGLGSLLLESGRFRMVEHKGKQMFIGDDAGITTHDVEDPNYWLRAKKTTIIPGKRVIFKDLKFYAGDKAVFWLPYLSQPLNADLGYHFLPGAKSNWGLYLLNRYGIMLGGEMDEVTGEREGAWLLSHWHFDIRSRRGLGLGLDLYDTRLQHNENLGWLKLYYLNDMDATLERSGVARNKVNPNRWKLELKHRIDLQKNDRSRTYLEFDLTTLSDRFFLEDFEPGVFKTNPSPDNKIGVFHRDQRYLLGLYARLKLNDFQQTDTRLPELFFDQIKAPLFDSPILHEGQTSFGIYREYLADFERRNLKAEASMLLPGDPRLMEINGLLTDRGYSRFHTYHEFSAPLNYQGKIVVTPRVGFGYSKYWSLDDGGSGFSRTHLSAGIDASMKFSKAYPNVVNPEWGVDGLLHVVQPYVNFTQLATNDLDPSFRGIETLTPSTRPRPLAVGRFSATDDLADWSIIRMGMRNRLLTKRNGSNHEWLSLDTYIDAFMDDPEFNRSFSNLYNDIVWHPLPWMRASLETQFPVISGGSGFRELAGRVTFMPNDSLEVSVGYRQLDNQPVLTDSNRVDIRAYARISEAWGVGFYQSWEFDDGIPEVQQYTVHRNFDSWTASLGLMMRQHKAKESEYGIMLNFTLKEFPSVRLPLSIDNE